MKEFIIAFTITFLLCSGILFTVGIISVRVSILIAYVVLLLSLILGLIVISHLFILQWKLQVENKMTEKENEQLKKEEKAWFHLVTRVGELKKENEQLKKNAIIWHKVTCFDEPDENGYITASKPTEEGREYLLLLKNKRILIDTLYYGADGYFFDDFAWKDIEAWAELPREEK